MSVVETYSETLLPGPAGCINVSKALLVGCASLSRRQCESKRTSSNRGRAIASVDRSSGSVLANVGGGDVLLDAASRAWDEERTDRG